MLEKLLNKIGLTTIENLEKEMNISNYEKDKITREYGEKLSEAYTNIEDYKKLTAEEKSRLELKITELNKTVKNQKEKIKALNDENKLKDEKIEELNKRIPKRISPGRLPKREPMKVKSTSKLSRLVKKMSN